MLYHENPTEERDDNKDTPLNSILYVDDSGQWKRLSTNRRGFFRTIKEWWSKK